MFALALALTLSWVAPVEREDNTPISMSEIAGYTVYYGSTSGEYPYSLEVNDAYQDSLELTEVPGVITYIVMTTRDVDGRESVYSEEAEILWNSADITRDGIVNSADLAYMKSKFFTNDPIADLNDDRIVNGADLAILARSYFKSLNPI